MAHPSVRALGLLAAAAAALALWTAGAATWAVTTAGTSFQPASLTIQVGDTVAWSGVAGHTVTSNTGAWPRATADFSHTFNAAGTFSYFCEFHGGMNGQVVVQQAPPTATATSTAVPTATSVSSSSPTSVPSSSPTPVPSLTPTSVSSRTPTPTPRPVPTLPSGWARTELPLVGDNGGLASGDVSVGAGLFHPRSLTVTVGATVLWAGQGGVHTVTSDSGLFDSGDLAAGGEFAFTFARAGTYPYFCRYHGAPGGFGHAGLVVVSAP